MTLLPAIALGQEAAWETYRAANTLAQAEAWEAALPKFRAVLEVATEPGLREAACYGVGLATHALVTSRPEQDLACEGVRALNCFLEGSAPSPRASALARQRRATLQAVCEPPPPPPPTPDRTAAAWMTGGAAVSAIAGGVLIGLAFADAAEVRDRDRVGTGALEDEAETKLVAGYLGLGLGAALGGVATWLWLRDSDAAVGVYPMGLGLGGHF